MSSSKYSISEGAVARHAGNLEQTHEAMNTALTQFSTALAGLPSVWRGASFASFAEVQGRWQTATTELNTALEDIRGRVSRSATIYDAGEADQASVLRQVGQSVDWSAGSFRG
ncbi:MAG: WXG100 family type VII secretion target [Mobilicoccus sp.]|nr:WXG100 family type VII secretion target [Mobilicoccus sp.]